MSTKDEIVIAHEDAFRSKKVGLNSPCDMIRVTMEMPINTWRTMKNEIFGTDTVKVDVENKADDTIDTEK